jgi:hypothetical protein
MCLRLAVARCGTCVGLRPEGNAHPRSSQGQISYPRSAVQMRLSNSQGIIHKRNYQSRELSPTEPRMP